MDGDRESERADRDKKTSAHGGSFPHGRMDESAVALESEPFVAFDHWIDAELAKLEARWLPFAAPIAARVKSWNRPVR